MTPASPGWRSVPAGAASLTHTASPAGGTGKRNGPTARRLTPPNVTAPPRAPMPRLAALALLALCLPTDARAQGQCDIDGRVVLSQTERRGDPGDPITVGYTYGISGGCPAFDVRVLVSTDRYPSSDDLVVGTETLPASGPQTNVGGAVTFAVPELPRGGYRILAVADPDDVVEEDGEGNNVNYGDLTVGGDAGGPDLVIVRTELEDEAAAPGERISFEYGVQNQGGTDVGDVEVEFFLVLRNAGPDAPRYTLGRETVGNVEAGETEEESEEVAIPAGVPPGAYATGITADPDNEVEEFDETNNTAGPGFITITGAVSSEPGAEAPGVWLAAWPNPAAGALTVQYQLPAPGEPRITVHDALGREVVTAASGTRGAGEHEASVDTNGWTPGVYVVRLTAGDAVATRTVTIVR